MNEGHFTRQLATIVSIDAVGFSRLMGFDEEAAVSAFEERGELIRQVCAAHGGRTFGVAGDSIMAEFGNPAKALLAAFEFQDKLKALNDEADERRRMPFRAGINTGDVIVRDESRYGDDVNISARLQELAPSGGVVVSETTWHHVRGQSAATFHDLGEQRLKNIVYPIKAFLAVKGEAKPGGLNGAGATTIPPAAGSIDPASPTYLGKSRRMPAGPPAVAVLPFRTESEEQAYIADGIAEDIILGLSSTRWLPVIAKSSSFQFRDVNLGTIAAGHSLGARYVVSGSLAAVNGHMRLKAVLEDVAGARTIWSRRFEREWAEMPRIQDEIGPEIVSLLEKEVDRAEQARTWQVPWESLETWQLVRRGRVHMDRRTREDTQMAYDLFMKAYERDPNSAAVLNELAWWHFWSGWLGFGSRYSTYIQDLEKVSEYARRSLFMDSQDARPHAHLGAVDIMYGRSRMAIEHLDEALRINPSFAFARSAKGSAHLLEMEPKKAIPLMLEAQRLSPFDLYRFHNLGELAAAYTLERNWAAALDAADRSLQLSPSYWYASVLKAGALARLKRIPEARQVVLQLQSRVPDFRIERTAYIPFADKSANALLIEGFTFAASM